jgi:uncharacterized protein (TIGR02246 family)
VSAKIFPTAQDAEAAFYEALERADLELMMAVWSDDEEILCVHPGGARLTGQDQVRESWRQILAGGTRARVHLSQQVAISGPMVAVHSVHENFSVPGEKRPLQAVVATNVYLRTAAGWRMIAHHGSPAPGQAEAPRETPKILH